MDDSHALSELQRQFEVLQKQQEKRKLAQTKKEAEKLSVTQEPHENSDDLELSKQGFQTDTSEER